MRTKNGKRIGPVPITLVAVFALAALLSAGLLLAPNGAQPVAAQDADCTVYVGSDSAIQVEAANGTRSNANAAFECSALGDTATVKFVGPVFGTDNDEAAPDNVKAPKIDLVIPDANGTLSAYMNGHVEYDTSDNRYELTSDGATAAGGTAAAGNAAPAPMKFKLQTVEAPLPERSQTTGTYEAQSVIITVSANVYIYGPGTPLTEAIADGPTTDARRELVTTDDSVMITFLGVPAIGKDGGDLNKKVDDVVLEQCESDTDDDMKMEGTDPTTCPTDYSADDDAPEDKAESLSKLIVRTGTDGTPMELLNGKSMDHEMNRATDSAATIYAVVEDAKGQALEDVEVTYMVTSVPAGIAASTRTFDSDVPDENPNVTGISWTSETEGDAIAMRTVSGLPTGKASYRVSVKVMAGSLNLGTIVLARAGKATTLDAGIYDYGKCVDKMGTATDMSDDVFKMSMEDCAMVSDPARFPREGMFAVSATTKDARGTKTGENWMIRDISKAPLKDILTVVKSRGDVSMDAYLLQVKDDAAYGIHTITLSNGKTGDDMLTQDIMFYVAGPPKMYKVEGPEAIPLRNRGTFTVSALDENDGVPHFITEKTMTDEMPRNDRVMVDAIYGTVRGVDRDGYLELDTKTGMGTFTFTLPRTEVTSGDIFTILVGEDDMQVDVMVYAGEAPPEETVPGMPMMVEAMAQDHMSIKVSWMAPESDGNSAITGYIIERRYMGDMMGVIPMDGYSGMDGANRSFAFSNAMEWWETLNCKGMLAAAGSDADPDMDSDAKSMYCAHYLNTEPSNVTDSDVELSDDAKMAVEALFMKRYVIIDDAMMMMHTDMDLMPMTEYTYRVSAVNDIGRSMWSEADSATTEAAPAMGPMLMAPTNVAAISFVAGSVSVTWMPGQDALGHIVVLFDADNNVVAHKTSGASADSADLTDVPAGSYEAVVVSFRSSSEFKLSEGVAVTVR